jgi:hypothetical protein
MPGVQIGSDFHSRPERSIGQYRAFCIARYRKHRIDRLWLCSYSLRRQKLECGRSYLEPSALYALSVASARRKIAARLEFQRATSLAAS